MAEPKVTSSKHLFHPTNNRIQLKNTEIQMREKQQIFMFEELEQEKELFFLLINDLDDWSIIKTVDG